MARHDVNGAARDHAYPRPGGKAEPQAGLRAAMTGLAAGAMLLAACVPLPAAAQALVPYVVEGDAIPQPLAAQRGDPQRGRAIVASRTTGLCLLCHPAPVPEESFQGNLAPDLAGVGARYSEGQLRLRVVDPRKLNPASFMPAFHSNSNPSRIGAAWVGKPILSAQQIEDVVAWLAQLR